MSGFVGKKTLAPGDTVGVLALTGATPGQYYTITVRGARLAVISEDGTVDFELENDKPLITNAEIVIKNISPYESIVVGLAIPVPASGGGGGGSGETPTLTEVLAVSTSPTASDMLFIDNAGTILQVNGAGVNMMTPDSIMASFGAGGVGITNNQNGDSTSITLGAVLINSSGAARWLRIADGATGSATVYFPESDGTMVVAPPIPTSGTYNLRAIDGVMTWVEEV